MDEINLGTFSLHVKSQIGYKINFKINVYEENARKHLFKCQDLYYLKFKYHERINFKSALFMNT